MNRFRKTDRQEGFSLVELLVTVVIIAVLAAIAIPLYTSQKNKSALASAQSDASAIVSEISTMLSGYSNMGTANIAISFSGGTITITPTAGTPAAAATGSYRLSPSTTISGNVALGATGGTPTFCIAVANTSGSSTQTAYANAAGLSTTATACSAAGVMS